jgi:hypothetical protein
MAKLKGRTSAGFALDRIERAMARQRQAELDRFWGRPGGTIYAVESAQSDVQDSFREWDKACDQEQGKRGAA